MKTSNASKLIAGALAFVMVLMMLPLGTMKVSAATQTFTLTGTDIVGITVDKTVIPAGTYGTNGFFTLTGSNTYRTSQKCIEVAKNETGSVDFTVTGTANVTITCGSTGNSNTSEVALLGADGNPVNTDAGVGATSISTTAESTITYTGLTAGTYKLVSPTTAHGGVNTNRGYRLYNLTVEHILAGDETLPSAETTEPVVTEPTPTVPAGPATTKIHNFTTDGYTSDDFYTISGSQKKSVSTTYNGETLTGALKIDSKATISFTAPANGTLTIVYGTTQASSISVNGTKESLPVAKADGVFVRDVTAGQYTIARGDKELWIFYISYVPEGGDTPQPAGDTMTAGSLTLEGNIGVNFYMDLTADTLADTGAKMVFTVNGVSKEVPVSEGVETADGIRFTYLVAAKEMNDTITAKVVRTDGTTSEEFPYSVREYCEGQLNNANADAKLKTLVAAMLNYGAAAQTHFNYNAANLANAGLETGTVTEMTAADLASYKGTVTYADKATAGITVSYGTLALESETVVRAYFTLAAGENIADYTFTVNGAAVTPFKPEGGAMYVLNIENIAAQYLEDTYTITVSKGGTEVLTMTYGAFSYAYSVVNSAETTQELKLLVSALYAYNQAANAYFAA